MTVIEQTRQLLARLKLYFQELGQRNGFWYLLRVRLARLWQKTELQYSYQLLPVELEVRPEPGWPMSCQVESRTGIGSQELHLTWTFPALLQPLLNQRLQSLSDALVSAAYYRALNRNRLPPEIQIEEAPYQGYMQRLLCLSLEFPGPDSISCALPAPFLPVAGAAFVLIYIGGGKIHFEILIPARLITGSQNITGYFQLEHLSFSYPAAPARAASYRLRHSGLRFACLQGRAAFACSFRPDRYVEHSDRLPILLMESSLLMRINAAHELELYQQGFRPILTDIQVADQTEDSGFSRYLKTRLQTDFDELGAFSSAHLQAERRFFSRQALSRAAVQFPLAKGPTGPSPYHARLVL